MQYTYLKWRTRTQKKTSQSSQWHRKRIFMKFKKTYLVFSAKWFFLNFLISSFNLNLELKMI